MPQRLRVRSRSGKRSSAQTTFRSCSSRLTHSLMRFQLANVWPAAPSLAAEQQVWRVGPVGGWRAPPARKPNVSVQGCSPKSGSAGIDVHLAVESRAVECAPGPGCKWWKYPSLDPFRASGHEATTGRGSPDVVQYGPNTRQNGGAGPTKDQHETTRCTTPLSLQNLHPRFKSGRRLQIS